MPPATLYYNKNNWDYSPFAYCKKLVRVNWGECDLGATITLFRGCSSLDYYDGILPNNLTEVQVACFMGCVSLTRMIFYEGIQTFGSDLFRDCSSIRYVEFPSSTKKLSLTYLFDGTHRNGIYVVMKAVNPPTLGGTYNQWWTERVYWYVPEESVAAYKAAESWSNVSGNIYPMSELPDEFRNL